MFLAFAGISRFFFCFVRSIWNIFLFKPPLTVCTGYVYTVIFSHTYAEHPVLAKLWTLKRVIQNAAIVAANGEPAAKKGGFFLVCFYFLCGSSFHTQLFLADILTTLFFPFHVTF